MYCLRCGAQLPDDSNFCDKCGASTSPEIACATAPAVATTPSAASVALKSFFSKKKNVRILAIALAVLVALIAVILIIASQPPKAKTIYLDDYFTVCYDGTDGFATAEIRWERTKINELNNEIFSLEDFNSYEEFLKSTDGKFTEYDITEYFEVLFSKDYDLRNGDEILLSLNYTHYTYNESMERDPIDAEDFKDAFNVNLKLRNESLVVEGLAPVAAFDPFAHITVQYSGTDGYGSLAIVAPQNEVATADPTKTFRYNVYNDGFELVLYHNGSYAFAVSFTCDRTYDLANGDPITFVIDSYFDNTSRQQLASYGFMLSKTEVTKTVSGLSPIVEYNPADIFSPVFSGYSGYGTFDNAFAENRVTLGAYTLAFTDDSSSYRRRIHIAILDENGNTLDSLTYQADVYYELTNGDTVTFTSNSWEGEFIESYGIDFVSEFTLTVSDLAEPLDPAIFAHASMLYQGYHGYGTAVLVPPTEEHLVYTVGEYTFKLTPSSSVSWGTTSYRITVVVEKDGENIFTLYYYTDETDGLANGEEIAFECSFYDSERYNYLNEYGIFFPAYYNFTVEGLSDTVATDPRQYVTYSFSGENGEIRMTLGLMQDSYTVGEYTVSLSTSYAESWGTTYAYLNFTVTDRDGNTVGEGNYRAYASGLQEGDTVYLDRYSLDNTAIATACGLIFSREDVSTIVSTK